MSEWLVLIGIVVAACSGLPGLFFSRNSMSGQWTTTFLAALGSCIGIGGVAAFWAAGGSHPIEWTWRLPGAEFSVAMDGLSAMFLVPIFLISLVGSVYGLGYWKQTEHPENGRKLRVFYGTMTAGMALLVISRNSILFLFGWEIMAISAFFLVATEDNKQEARDAGWIYLVATHTATLCLFALFALLRRTSGSFALAPIGPEIMTSRVATAAMILALCGFGIKAGMMPLHVWLPGAHAIAPSHVSAIMSGVIVKMGIYGLVRVTSLLPDLSMTWGAIVLGLGIVSGILGVAYAIGQHDLKRLLAYHTIENIGIIVIGIGLAVMGRSLGRAELVILGLSGALLHVWNHALFKALLFLSAGSVIHSAHSREVDELGGLAKAMPWTAVAFLCGAVAICGLPPLNGFVSEFLIYLGLFGAVRKESGPSLIGAAMAVPALALIGALALACFVKVVGAVFLGSARSDHARHVHESPMNMLAPMGVLVACCFVIGLAPTLVAPLLERAVWAWAPELKNAGEHLATLAPLSSITWMVLMLAATLLLATIALRHRLRRSIVESVPTWGCGYVAPTQRMQYTASSFAQMIVDLFGWALRPRRRKPTVAGLFPGQTDFRSDVPDAVLDGAVLPAFRRGARLIVLLRVFQQGSVQTYLLYIFIALLALLLWR